MEPGKHSQRKGSRRGEKLCTLIKGSWEEWAQPTTKTNMRSCKSLRIVPKPVLPCHPVKIQKPRLDKWTALNRPILVPSPMKRSPLSIRPRGMNPFQNSFRFFFREEAELNQVPKHL